MGPLNQAVATARLQAALPNARDLNEAFPAIPPGRVIRCANPSSTSPEDTEYLLGEMRVRDMIDLRAAEEMLEDDPGSVLMARALLLSYRRGWLQPGQLFAHRSDAAPLPAAAAASFVSRSMDPDNNLSSSTSAAAAAATTTTTTTTTSPSPARTHVTAYAYASGPPAATLASEPLPSASPAPPASTSAPDPEPSSSAAAAAAAAASKPVAVRHNISLLDRGRYYLSLASRLPTSVTAAALLTNLYSKPAARAMLLPYVNGGGLPMLYEMLLESSQIEIRQVMEVLLAAAEARHCVLFFCRAGKDRTGLVAAMVLAVAGASEQQIVADYARSDAYHRVALAGLESREELAGLDRAQFERAPPEVMEATLEYVRRRYGSLPGYLTAIGFGPDRQQRLRELLTCEW